MTTPRSAGRPKAISREMLEEAACELFLERGYAHTSVADITQRAGVSRATFFNYVASKSDLLWATVDDALEAVAQELDAAPATTARVEEALTRAAAGLTPGVAVLAMGNAEAMGVREELLATGAARQARLAGTLREALAGQGGALWADVRARAYAGAFFAALQEWAVGDPGVEPFSGALAAALAILRDH